MIGPDRSPRLEAPAGLADAELEHALRETTGTSVRVLSVESRRYPYGSSHSLETLDIETDAWPLLRLLAKTHDGSADPGADVRDPAREGIAYRHVLQHMDCGAPRCYGEIRNGSGVTLLIERVEGRELYQIGELDTWLEVARWLATFHRAAARLDPPPGLLVRDAAFWWTRWDRAVTITGRSNPHDGRRLRSLEPAFRAAVGLLLDATSTLIHGEFYPANILIQADGTGHPVRPVDWEMAGRGAPHLDLAALTAGRWNEAERNTMVEAYQTIAHPGGQGSGDPLFRRTLAAARLALAVQWLGWAEGWTPPREQANDWLHEAVQAAASAV